MKWRPLPVVLDFGSAPDRAQPAPAPEPEPEPRLAHIAEALARLEAATRLRDQAAAARILNGLAGTPDGQWLLRQCVAAGLREVAQTIADADGAPAVDPSVRSVGPAA